MPPSPLSRAKKRLQTFLQTDLDYLVRGGSWLVVSQAGAALLSLATAVAFGHVAAADTYGNYKYVLALAGLFGAFSLTGIGTAVTQATARGLDGSLRQGVRLSLAWSWGVVVIALAAAGYYGFFVHNQFLALSLVIVALLSPVLNSFSLFDPYLIGKKRFDLNTILSFLNALVPVAAVIVTLFLTNRAIVIILVYFVANTLSDVVCYARTLRFAANDATYPKL
ncbi:MAG TPA: oligosaccharide flippase family protein, partial [Candidatus Paceibacterota bacterium]|nr:oligosaccharide flippase family protein [Candidatus Paceibacterota bacterium]